MQAAQVGAVGLRAVFVHEKAVAAEFVDHRGRRTVHDDERDFIKERVDARRERGENVLQQAVKAVLVRGGHAKSVVQVSQRACFHWRSSKTL